MNETLLLERCCQEPEAHLAVAAMSHYRAYVAGYGFVADFKNEEFDWVPFEEQLMKDYGLTKRWPCSLSNLCFLTLAEGDPKCLHVYLKYRRQLATPVLDARHKTEREGNVSLPELLSKGGHLQKRAHMYFGCDASAAHVWSFLSGLRWAETDYPTSTTSGWATRFMVEFQSWIESRYPYSKDVPWHRTLWFNRLFSSKSSLDDFFTELNSFQRGDSPLKDDDLKEAEADDKE